MIAVVLLACSGAYDGDDDLDAEFNSIMKKYGVDPHGRPSPERDEALMQALEGIMGGEGEMAMPSIRRILAKARAKDGYGPGEGARARAKTRRGYEDLYDDDDDYDIDYEDRLGAEIEYALGYEDAFDQMKREATGRFVRADGSIEVEPVMDLKANGAIRKGMDDDGKPLWCIPDYSCHNIVNGGLDLQWKADDEWRHRCGTMSTVDDTEENRRWCEENYRD